MGHKEMNAALSGAMMMMSEGDLEYRKKEARLIRRLLIESCQYFKCIFAAFMILAIN